MHINNALKEELADEVVVAKFANTTQHGAIEGKTQTHELEYFNLEMVTGHEEPLVQRRQQTHCCHALPMVPEQQPHPLSSRWKQESSFAIVFAADIDEREQVIVVYSIHQLIEGMIHLKL